MNSVLANSVPSEFPLCSLFGGLTQDSINREFELSVNTRTSYVKFCFPISTSKTQTSYFFCLYN